MAQESDPHRPAAITVRREAGGWPLSAAAVRIDGRPVGYLAPGVAKTFRVAPGAHAVTVRFGGHWTVYGPRVLSGGERLGLACGRRGFLSAGWGAPARRAAFVAGLLLSAYAGLTWLPGLRGPLEEWWVELPDSPYVWHLRRVIQAATTGLAGAVAGLVGWTLVASPLALAVRRDAARRYYLGEDGAPTAAADGRNSPVVSRGHETAGPG